MPSALLENAGHNGPVKDIGCRAPVDEPGNGIVRQDAEIMNAELQHAGGNHKPDGACDQIADIRLLFVPPAPAEEENHRDRDHRDHRDSQRGDAASADDDILKLRHFPSPPQTSTQKPL